MRDFAFRNEFKFEESHVAAASIQSRLESELSKPSIAESACPCPVGSELGSPARGILFGAMLSLPIWTGIGFAFRQL